MFADPGRPSGGKPAGGGRHLAGPTDGRRAGRINSRAAVGCGQGQVELQLEARPAVDGGQAGGQAP